MRTIHININDSDEIPQFINNFTNEENLKQEIKENEQN